MPSGQRRRVTIDLRGLDERLAELAARRCVTAASVIRGAVLAMLERAEPSASRADAAQPTSRKGETVKVTLRLPRSHAHTLAWRSRSACVSLGDYVCGLLDGSAPVEVPREVAFMLASLDESTDRLAEISADLGALLRQATAPTTPKGDSREHLVVLSTLRAEVRDHLSQAAALVRDLEPLRRSIHAAARAEQKREPG